MKRRRVVPVNVFNNKGCKLTSGKIERNASEKDNISCINNRNHVRIHSVQSSNVLTPYERNNQQENQARVKYVHKIEPYTGFSIVCDTGSCIIHDNSIKEVGCVSNGVTNHTNASNIGADIVKYTAVQEYSKSNVINMVIGARDTCEKRLEHVVSIWDTNTISQPSKPGSVCGSR